MMSARTRLATLAVVALLPMAAGAQLPSMTASPAPEPVDAARSISLDEAIRLAHLNAPALVSARGSMRNNAAAVRRSYAAFMPSLNFTASSGRSQGVSYFQGQLVPLRGDPWSFRNGVSANLQIFDGGSRFADLNRAKAQVDASSAAEITQRYNVALNVKQQYYAVLAARESELAARQQLQQAEQQLAAAAARLAAGSATKSDSLRTAIQVGNAQLAVLTARNNQRVANAALTRIVGAPQTVTASDEALADLEPLDVESATLERLADEAPVVRQAQAEFVASRAGVKSAKSAYLPTITTSYSYSANQSSQGFEGGNVWLLGRQNPNSKQLNFNFSYPIFNQLQRETAIIQAEVSQRNAEASLRDARLAADQSLTQALGQLELAQERMRIQQQAVLSGEEDLRVQTARYELGSSTLLDVLTSQTTLNQARLSLIQARFDARIARAQIEALIGREL